MARETVFEADVIVGDEQGLHFRPKCGIIKCASQFRATVEILAGDASFDAKSDLEMHMLFAPHGARGERLHVRAQGDDAKEAVLALVRLISGFDEWE